MSEEEKLFLLKKRMDVKDRPELDEALDKIQYKPQGLVEALKPLGAAFDDVEEHLAKVADECPYELKLAVTAWVFKKIVEHGKEPGSFRYLIYDRMGFDMDAYVPLYLAGGMVISNEFDLTEKKDA